MNPSKLKTYIWNNFAFVIAMIVILEAIVFHTPSKFKWLAAVLTVAYFIFAMVYGWRLEFRDKQSTDEPE